MNSATADLLKTESACAAGEREMDFSSIAADVMQLSPCLILLIDADTLAVVCQNKMAQRRLSLPARSEGPAPALRELFGAKDQERLMHTILAERQEGAYWEGECALRESTGNEFLVHGRMVRLEKNGRRYFCFHAYPLPSRAEEEIILSDHKILRALLETVPDAIYLKDAQSKFVMVSKSMAQRCGHQTMEEMIGHTDFDYFTLEHAQPAYETEQRIISRGEHVLGLEEKETWLDGLVTWANTTKLPLHDDEGQIIGIFGISRDVTLQKVDAQERSELEAKLQLAGKLESIGRLSAGIAHEINTPTQFIAHNTRFISDAVNDLITLARQGQALQHAVEKNDTALEAAARAFAASVKKLDLEYLVNEVPRTIAENLDGLERVQQIVRSLKEYSHPTSREKVPADLNAAIKTALNVAKHEWKYVAEAQLELAEDLPPVPCNISEITQVVINLVINAAHAIEAKLRKTGEKKGLITVRTRHEDKFVVVAVQDSGTGIPAEVRDNVFDPFFTTKPMGKGTGQGLHLVQTIVATNHEGSIEFTTDLGVGTTFTFKLPVATGGV